jgi:hypothetical protein
LKEIEDVEEEGSVDGMREREGHLVGGGRGTSGENERTPGHFGSLSVNATCYVIIPPVEARSTVTIIIFFFTPQAPF